MSRLIRSALWSAKHSQLVELQQDPEECHRVWTRAAEGFRQTDPEGERVRVLLRKIYKKPTLGSRILEYLKSFLRLQ